MVITGETDSVSLAGWIPVIEESRLREDAISRVFPKGLAIILIRKGQEIFALRNRCPHMGCMLSAGQLDGYTLRCPCHEWHFDIRTGEFIAAKEIKIQSFECKSVDGTIHLLVEE